MPKPAILFTSFEPSGDDHASAVIGRLVSLRPEWDVFAWGGPRMQAAGATLVERTGTEAVMGLPGLAKIREHRAINRRVKAWLAQHRPIVHVPVDSPAANFPICALSRAVGASVVHLVAPQVWAWGSWRVAKLRRLSDHVLCILPFEERWLSERGVRATFVGHPIFSHALDEPALRRSAEAFPQSGFRLALMPGSRPAEWKNNFPLMLATFRTLHAERRATGGLVGLVAATDAAAVDALREIARAHGGWPEDLHVVHGSTDAAICWCEAALVVSGTVSLQIARQCKPMVVMYVSSPLVYQLIGRWVVSTPFFALPNLIAQREIVPEFVPHFGDEGPITQAMAALIDSDRQRGEQSAELAAVVAAFRGHDAAAEAAQAIARAGDEMLEQIAPSGARAALGR